MCTVNICRVKAERREKIEKENRWREINNYYKATLPIALHACMLLCCMYTLHALTTHTHTICSGLLIIIIIIAIFQIMWSQQKPDFTHGNVNTNRHLKIHSCVHIFCSYYLFFHRLFCCNSSYVRSRGIFVSDANQNYRKHECMST